MSAKTTLPSPPILPHSTTPIPPPNITSLPPSVLHHHHHPLQASAPILILIAGAPCSGKKTVLQALKAKLLELSSGVPPTDTTSASPDSFPAPAHPPLPLTITTLHMQDFHIELTPQECIDGGVGKVGGKRDLECLDEYDLGLMADVIEKISRKGVRGVKVPRWVTPTEGSSGSGLRVGRREWREIELEGATTPDGNSIPDIIITEGHYLLHPPRLRDLASVKIFTDQPPDIRLARRVIRDSQHPTNPLSLDYIFDQHIRFGKPSAEIVIQPTKVLADIILPRGADGPGVELIANGVLDDLRLLRGGSAAKGGVGAGTTASAMGSGVGMGELYPSPPPVTTTLVEGGDRGGYYETV